MKTFTAIGVVVALIVAGGAWYWMGLGTMLPPLDASGVSYCAESQRSVDVCTQDYKPVCATVNIQCIKAPCNPIQETFSNSCTACKNSLVSSYLVGECK